MNLEPENMEITNSCIGCRYWSKKSEECTAPMVEGHDENDECPYVNEPECFIDKGDSADPTNLGGV